MQILQVVGIDAKTLLPERAKRASNVASLQLNTAYSSGYKAAKREVAEYCMKTSGRWHTTYCYCTLLNSSFVLLVTLALCRLPSMLPPCMTNLVDHLDRHDIKAPTKLVPLWGCVHVHDRCFSFSMLWSEFWLSPLQVCVVDAFPKNVACSYLQYSHMTPAGTVNWHGGLVATWMGCGSC